MMNFAPIILFAFNRLDALKNTVEHLLCCDGADQSALYVFVDGPRDSKEGEREKVEKVREYVASISGFKKVDYCFEKLNKGLAQSIISGVSRVLDKHGRAIVLEDDLEVAPGFLTYMNTMLDGFDNDKRVMQISGFSTKFTIPKGYPNDVYLNRRAESWGWATWKDRWDSVDWEIAEIDQLKADSKFKREFNDIGSDMYDMLLDSVATGRIWAVKFAYAMFRQGAFQVSPIYSLVRNEGFGTDSTNCNSYNHYKYVFNDGQREFRVPDDLQYDRAMDKSANRYWSLPYRVYGKIMTLIYKVIG